MAAGRIANADVAWAGFPAVRQGADGRPELLVDGKDKAPLLHVPLTQISDKQDNPIEVSAEQQGDAAMLTLKILGKYSAGLAVSICD